MTKLSTNQKRVVYLTIFLIAILNLVAILHISARSNQAQPNVNGLNTIHLDSIRLNPDKEDINKDTEDNKVETSESDIEGGSNAPLPTSYTSFTVSE